MRLETLASRPMVVFDVDDTLAPLNRPMPGEVQAALCALEGRATIALASGKPSNYLAGFCRAAGLDTGQTILLGENGVDIRLSATIPPIGIVPTDALVPTAVRECLQSIRLHLHQRFGTRLWFQSGAFVLTPFPCDLSDISPGDLSRTVSELAQTDPLVDLSLVEVFTHSDSIDIVPAGLHKGAGLRVLCEAAGIALESVYAGGDGSNDVPMFRVVGNPVAVGRRPEILALEEEGVPRFDGVLEALAYVAERIGE